MASDGIGDEGTVEKWTYEEWTELNNAAKTIGALLEKRFPRLVQIDRDPVGVGGDPMGTWLPRSTLGVEDIGNGLVDKRHVESITEEMIYVVAEILQAWLDAGSERVVTFEDEALRKAIEDHVRSWSDGAPAQLG